MIVKLPSCQSWPLEHQQGVAHLLAIVGKRYASLDGTVAQVKTLRKMNFRQIYHAIQNKLWRECVRRRGFLVILSGKARRCGRFVAAAEFTTTAGCGLPAVSLIRR